MIECLAAFKPDLVIFDNAGRGAQIRAAHAWGARVIYISSRRRQRAKAFRLSWMRRSASTGLPTRVASRAIWT